MERQNKDFLSREVINPGLTSLRQVHDTGPTPLSCHIKGDLSKLGRNKDKSIRSHLI